MDDLILMNTKLLPEVMEVLIAESSTPEANLHLDTQIATEVASFRLVLVRPGRSNARRQGGFIP